MDYKIGDIVMLKSGGPSMTVHEIGDFLFAGIKSGVQCVWFDGTKRMEEVFHPDTIEHCKGAPTR